MRAVLPPAVRARLDADEQGRAWLETGAHDVALMWREDLSDEVRGWVIGIAMFADPLMFDHVGIDRRLVTLVPFVLDAIVAGMRAGASGPHVWRVVEKIVGDRAVPAGFADLVPIGLASKRAGDRLVAARFARRLGIAVEKPALPSPPADEPIELLRRLVAAWGDSRDVALEEPIARLGRQVAHGRGPLVGRSNAELEQTWHALAAHRDAGDVDRLFDTPWPHLWKTATLRVNALAKFPPDPRIPIRLSHVSPRYNSQGSHPFHVAAATLLAVMPTPSILYALEGIDFGTAATARTYRKVREAVAARTSRPADPAVLAEAADAKPVRELAALWAEHAANPGDVALRMVLADALQANGDPRGEFIILQSRIADGTADAAAAKRVTALLDAHRDAWLATLPGVDRRVANFERGFLTRVVCAAAMLDVRAALDRPAWTTVEDLAMTNMNADVVGELVARMPLLRTLRAAHGRVVDELARAGRFPSLRAIAAASWVPRDREAFPNLAVAGFMWPFRPVPLDELRDVVDAARTLGVTLVHFAAPEAQLADILAMRADGPPEQRILVGKGTYFHDVGWCARFWRDEPRAEVTAHPLYHRRNEVLERVLAEAGITQIAVVPRIDLAA